MRAQLLASAALLALAASPAAAQTLGDARSIKAGAAKLSDLVKSDARVSGFSADANVSYAFGTATGTDNAQKIRDAIAACPASAAGCEIVLPAGRALIGSTIVVNRGVTFRGAGHSGTSADLDGTTVSGTVLYATFLTGDVFQIATNQPVEFHDLEISATAQRTSGACLAYIGDQSGQFAYARDPNIENVKFKYCYDGIDFRYSNSWRVANSLFTDFKRYGVLASQSGALDDPDGPGPLAPVNPGAADYGDLEFSGNRCQPLNTSIGWGDACLRVEATGSLQVYGNKFLGSKRGLDLALKYGPTGTINVATNSFENQTDWSIDLRQTTPGIDYANIAIIGNQFAQHVNKTAAQFAALGQPNLNPLGTIHVAAGTPAGYDKRWLRGLTIIGNTFNPLFEGSRATAQVLIEDGMSVVVANNVAYANATGFPTTSGQVPFLSMTCGNGTTNGVLDGIAVNNVVSDTPAGPYGSMGACASAEDKAGGASRVRGDREQAVTMVDPNNRVIDVLKPLAGIAGWTTLRTFTLASMSGLTGYGTLQCVLQGHTNGIGFGSLRLQRDFSFYGGAWTVTTIGTDTASTGQAPQFQIITTTTPTATLQLQARSGNGTASMTSGLMDCRVRLPNADGGQASWAP